MMRSRLYRFTTEESIEYVCISADTTNAQTSRGTSHGGELATRLRLPSRTFTTICNMPPWGETTEAALTGDLAEDLREAWDRIRETAAEFGEQRIYASHHSIMFSKEV